MDQLGRRESWPPKSQTTKLMFWYWISSTLLPIVESRQKWKWEEHLQHGKDRWWNPQKNPTQPLTNNPPKISRKLWKKFRVRFRPGPGWPIPPSPQGHSQPTANSQTQMKCVKWIYGWEEFSTEMRNHDIPLLLDGWMKNVQQAIKCLEICAKHAK